jgi:hypothetical protein
MKQSFKTFCPLFPGFYNTVFEYDGESDDIDSYNEENGTELKYNDFNFDYRDYEERVGKAFVNRLEKELRQFLPIKLTFEAIQSPKEYNFTNDSIYVKAEVSLTALIKLINNKKSEASAYFKDRYTSCSGFISFHSNDINDWLNKNYILEQPEHRVGALLDCLAWMEIGEDDIYYWCDSECWINYTVNENA